ncbi:MAG: LacI family DNA-binding transcriptional regulator [bacterium]
MAASLKDVAAMAGVSIKTVSNVVNDYPFVSVQTRARVNAAIKELEYQPNLSARGLRTGRSNLIALALPVLDEPYFAEIASLVVYAAEERGLTVLIDQTGGDRQRERQAAEGVRANLIDGAISSPLALTQKDIEVLTRRRPIVLLGEQFSAVGADHVAIDSVAAARDATSALLELGRRRIAFIGADTKVNTAAQRLTGYEQALRAAGRTVDERLIIRIGPFRRVQGYQAAQELLRLRRPPDAIFCLNDLMALGAMRALIEAGARVPQDVAVMGIDDIEDGRFGSPTLSTVSPDKRAIAAIAVDLLALRIRGGSDDPPRDVAAGYQLVMRESTGS